MSGGGAVLITDEILAAAAKELSLAMIAVFPDPEKEIHNFSLRFNQKMKKLVRKTIHHTRYLWTKRIAGFALVLFVGFMVVFMISPSVRANVIGWIKEQYESYIEYMFPNVRSVVKEEKYMMTFLPETYEEIIYVDEEDYCLTVYANNLGQKIDFLYSKDPEAGSMMVKLEGSTIINTYINGCQADIYLPDNPENATSIIWYDADKNMMFYISKVSSIEEIIKLAENVKYYF